VILLHVFAFLVDLINHMVLELLYPKRSYLLSECIIIYSI